MKHLIVSAGDFGLAPEANPTVEMAHRQRFLVAASLVVERRSAGHG